MKIRFMTPQPGKETVTTYILPKISSSIHLLPNISLNKDNSTMKFGQLMEYNKRNTCSRSFYFFKKALYDVKASALQLNFNVFQ